MVEKRNKTVAVQYSFVIEYTGLMDASISNDDLADLFRDLVIFIEANLADQDPNGGLDLDQVELDGFFVTELSPDSVIYVVDNDEAEAIHEAGKDTE